MQFADSHGVKLFVQSTGAGIPIVFVHEFAGDYRNYDDQVRFFGPNFRCITFNARGYPPSEVPTDVEQYGQAFAVEDIASVMRWAGVENAHIVGVSMGGYATLNFGLTYPERARSLTLVGAGHGSDPARREQFLRDSAELAERLVTMGMEQGIEHYANSTIRRRFKEKNPRGFEQFNRQFAEHSALGSSLTTRGYQMRRQTIYELEAKLRELRVPTLIVTGDDDEPCIEPALFMKRTIPDARLWIVPRTTHAVNLEEPEAFNRVVFDFILSADQQRQE
ncbi:alpha/beta fold hydrolase [Cupriavidus pampae]|uniref:2-hydroxy-6-oxononadienedioate/2-hydroxy-6-oxononatrienedioate hydrolase n=1 Tax=Cupriavidus pampae TaxID=659251 RepID=A0ABN7ZHJ8_9BURK|nr:alpha/beta hydrolase [Cupriavidus pampae]CAG9184643.1 2-hydroxy-6-oxononadienedioate/2-hydroxy-6-oxononatrienedioate hydrolase [Cupriavidus pampae]